jgi:hypothetical protein
MKKQSTFLTTIFAFVISSFAFVSNKTTTVFSQSETIWFHYEAVEPTENVHGSKEFWANCTTFEHSLIKPDSSNIKEGVPFESTIYFDQLTVDDDRYIHSIAKQRSLGMVPFYDGEAKTVTYGLYPQLLVTDTELLNTLSNLFVEENSWVCYESEYYAKRVAKPDSNSYLYFENKTKIQTGEEYWFKCTPIVWDILEDKDNKLLLLSDRLLDSTTFYSGGIDNRIIDGKTIYRNNYEHSDIRSWLNADFYNNAFQLNDSYIQVTEVNNEQPHTYSSGNTLDKVFIFSWSELKKSNYGFSSEYKDIKRAAKPTDWAKINGARCEKGDSQVTRGAQYNGLYWTRTSSDNSIWVTGCGIWGGPESFSVGLLTYACARPAITINKPI